MIYQPRSIKRCSTCKIYKPADRTYFYRSKNKFMGLDDRCKECDRVYRSKTLHLHRIRAYRYFVNHKDRYKTYYRNNSDKIKQRSALWQKNNPDKKAQARKNNYKQNPQKQRERSKRYINKYPERVRTRHHVYSVNNRKKRAVDSQKRRARVKNLRSDFTVADWNYCLNYWHGCCAYCGKQRGLFQPELAQDHFIPVTKGGDYIPANIVPACHGEHSCNLSKHNSDPYKWLDHQFGKRKAKQIAKRIAEFFATVRQIE